MQVVLSLMLSPHLPVASCLAVVACLLLALLQVVGASLVLLRPEA